MSKISKLTALLLLTSLLCTTLHAAPLKILSLDFTGDSYIPMEVTSSLYGPKSEVLEYERVVYSNPQLNAQLPPLILQFEIPKSVKVKEIEW